MKARFTLVLLAVLAAMPGVLSAQQEILKNGSMEFGPGPGAPDPMIADKWTEFGGNNIERSPTETWVLAQLGPYTAPANTARVRVTCRLKWVPGNIWGAVYWDDANLSIDGGPNALLNGDFETAGVGPGQSPIGIDDWMGFNDQEKSDDYAHEGTYSLKLGVREPYSGLYQNTQVLVAGDHLLMTAYAWNPSEDPLVGSSRAGIKLEFAYGGTPPPPEELLSFDQDDPLDTWVLVTYTTTVPAEATGAKVVMIADDTSTTNGPIYFDSAYAERSSAPGANQLLNPSFELGPGGANGLTDWTEFGGADCTAWKNRFEVPAQQGSYVLKIAGSCVAGVFQEIPVVTGETLTISAYLRSKSSDPFNDEAGPRAGVKVEWVLGAIPDPVDIGPPGSPNTIHASSPQDTWIQLTIDYTMPPGSNATARFVNIIEKGNALTGHVYFDSCSAIVLNWPAYCRGDMNCDDQIDFADINPFVKYVSDNAGWQAAYPDCPVENGDINENGQHAGNGALFDDINAFVALLSSAPLPIACP